MNLFRQLYFWVLVAIVLGVLLGWLAPETGVALKPLGDAFIAMIKMLIGPIIFCTVVLGISGAGDIRKAGRVGGKALLYFEAVSTLGLVLGLVIMHFIRPGEGFNVNPANLDPNAVSGYVEAAAQEGVAKFLLHIIPTTFTDAFTKSGNLLQVLLLAVLFGYAMTHMGSTGEIIHTFLDKVAKIFFGMMKTVMYLAPIGAGSAMAFTVGEYGMSALEPLAELIGVYYLACFLFIFVVLGTIARLAGFSIIRFLLYLRTEILTVLGTSSSETALVPLMEKLERLGCSRSVVGLVVPAGYSFNLDGTSIYLTTATLFLAQAMNINLTLEQELTLLGVAMLTSKGASGVPGSGFITLAATLAVVPSIPVYALALILGIDRFMDEGRAVTNFIGNGVATIVVAKWEKDVDHDQLQKTMNPSSP